jgi:hypothetical protein
MVVEGYYANPLDGRCSSKPSQTKAALRRPQALPLNESMHEPARGRLRKVLAFGSKGGTSKCSLSNQKGGTRSLCDVGAEGGAGGGGRTKRARFRNTKEESDTEQMQRRCDSSQKGNVARTDRQITQLRAGVPRSYGPPEYETSSPHAVGTASYVPRGSPSSSGTCHATVAPTKLLIGVGTNPSSSARLVSMTPCFSSAGKHAGAPARRQSARNDENTQGQPGTTAEPCRAAAVRVTGRCVAVAAQLRIAGSSGNGGACATPRADAIAVAYSSRVTPCASPDATLNASAGAVGRRSTRVVMRAATSSAHATRKRLPGCSAGGRSFAGDGSGGSSAT